MKKYTTNDIKSKRALSITEASDYACVSRATISNWLMCGLLPYEDLPGRGKGNYKFRLIRRNELDEFLNKHHNSFPGRNNKTSQKPFLMPKDA